MAATLNGHDFNKVTVVLGTQWGDEGKGKLVDLLSGSVDVVARCQGGNNAGHTVVSPEGVSYAFHLLPSGLVHEHVAGILGNGVVIHLPDLFNEIKNNEKKGLVGVTGSGGRRPRLFLSSRAHLVFDLHQQVDALQEALRTDSKTNLGTTKKGIGPAYSSKAGRSGLRMADLVCKDFDKTFGQKFRRLVCDYEAGFGAHGLSVDVEAEIKRYRDLAEHVGPMVTETVALMHKQLKDGKRILVEGANASMLDIDFGTYPFVTSSNCSVGGVLTGLGIPPARIGDVFGVVKAYTTRVGTGAFPTEQANEIGDFLQRVGREFGVTTGRKRRCGWLDIPLLRYTNMINNYTAVAVTKLDILDELDEIKIGVEYLKNGVPLDHFPSSEEEFDGLVVEYVTMSGWKTPISECRKFEDLPVNAQIYISQIEELLKVPVGWIGVGQGRDAIISRRF